MPAANRIRPHDVFTEVEWATLSARQPWRGPLLVAHAWAIIIAAMTLVAIWTNPLTIILTIMLIGARQLGLAILMHEAAHGALHPNRKVNDLLGHWFCAAPVGAHLASYRAYHLKHHQYVQQPEDPDLVLAAPFPTTQSSLRRKFIRDLSGQTFLKQRFGLSLMPKATPSQEGKMEKNPVDIATSKQGIRHHIFTNLIMLCVLSLIGYWWIYPLTWLGALATWLPFVTRVRNIGEHAGVADSDDPLSHARTTHASWWERLFIAPYWVHYHSEHHAFMHLPCYRLKSAHELLVEKGFGERIPQADGYGAVLRVVSNRQ